MGERVEQDPSAILVTLQERVRQGDDEALVEIWVRVESHLRGVAIQLAPSSEDQIDWAKDVLQDVSKNLRRYVLAAEDVQAYLVMATKGRARDKIRGPWHRLAGAADVTALPLADDKPNPLEILLKQEWEQKRVPQLRRALVAAIGRIATHGPHGPRRAYVLECRFRIPPEEYTTLAEALGVSKRTVELDFTKAKAELRSILGSMGFDLAASEVL